MFFFLFEVKLFCCFKFFLFFFVGFEIDIVVFGFIVIGLNCFVGGLLVICGKCFCLGFLIEIMLIFFFVG